MTVCDRMVERFGLVESMKKMVRIRKEEIKWRSQDKGNIVHASCRMVQEIMERKEKESVMDDGTEEG